MSETLSPPLNITELVEKYLKLRDLKSTITNEAKQKCGKIDVALEHAEAAILKFFHESGMDSAGCAAGTAYKSTRTSATVADWDAFIDHVRANEAWHMLEHRVSKTAVEEYVAAENDLPPGVNWKSDVTINVRRT